MAIIYGHMRMKTKAVDTFIDYLLMGRQLTLPFFTMTLVATWYGGIFGVTQIAFEKGIFNFVTQGIFWYVTYIIFALLLVDKIHSFHATTLPDLVGKMFGQKARVIAAIFNFFNVVPVVYAISLGLLVQTFFGLSFEVSIFLSLSIVCFYCIFGGFRAVVLSDVVQFFVMCSSVLFVVFYSYTKFGGINFLEQNLPSTHFEVLGKDSFWEVCVWGFIALSTLVDPNFYQRCFAAKSPQVAKKGIFISTLIWFCFDICTSLGGMYARAAMPEAKSTEAYLTYSLSILPDGLRGFFIAGLVATIVSTIDSYIFIASNTLSFDFFPTKKFIKTNQVMGVLFVGFITFVMATIFEGNIKSIWKTLGSYSASCLLFPVMMGYIFPGKISDNEFSWMVGAGVIGTTFWRFNPMVDIDELYIGIFATFVVLLLSKTLQLLFPALFLQRKVK